MATKQTSSDCPGMSGGIALKPPLSLGWVSGKLLNPFVVIADATGSAVAQALGPTPEDALDTAKAIIYAVNTFALGGE